MIHVTETIADFGVCAAIFADGSTMVEGNARMRAVNARLGYRERPAWIVVEGPA